MQTEQAEVLTQRLREIGFSDRAVGMILEQVDKVGLVQTDVEGLQEQAATYETVAATRPVGQPKSALEAETTNNLLVIAGAVIAFLSIILGWSALTSSGSGELAIMAGTPTGSNWFQGLQAMLLAGWVALPPLWSVWQGDINSRLRQLPTLAVWCSITLVLATLLIASAS